MTFTNLVGGHSRIGFTRRFKEQNINSKNVFHDRKKVQTKKGSQIGGLKVVPIVIGMS